MKFIQRGLEIELTNEEVDNIRNTVDILTVIAKQMGTEKTMSTDWYDLSSEEIEKIINILEGLDGCVLE